MSKAMEKKLKSDAGNARHFEKLDTQFVRHNPSKPVSTKPTANYEQRMLDAHSLEALKPDGKVLGMNEFGRPTAMFVYGNDRTTENEYEADVDMHKVERNGVMVIEVVGMQLLCPKCASPIYIRGGGLDGGHDITIHFDQMVRSNVDGKYRPLVTVDGTFGCDYSDAEVSGVTKSRASHVLMRCNWRGGIYKGRCLDHSIGLAGSG
jgi:hypothetical protein